MLPYFKKYLFAAYALSVLIPVASLAAFSVVMGGNVVKTLPGLFSSLMLFFACLYVMPKLMGQAADKRAGQLVSLYNDACDPAALVEQGAPVARAIKAPYRGQGAWFLSFYALALLDVGRREEAARIGENMLSSASAAADGPTRVAMLVNVEPLVARLFGAQAALGVIDEALSLLAGDGVPGPTAAAGAADDGAAAQRAFLSWERGLREAERAGDDEALLDKHAHVRATAGYPLRMRVLAAADEAAIHRRRAEGADERECLAFVVEHGGGLPAAAEAETRLAELDG